jgi:hypothetical protein
VKAFGPHAQKHKADVNYTPIKASKPPNKGPRNQSKDPDGLLYAYKEAPPHTALVTISAEGNNDGLTIMALAKNGANIKPIPPTIVEKAANLRGEFSVLTISTPFFYSVITVG